MKPKTFNQNAAVRSAIRRVFSRSPIVREIMFKVRREVPKYNKDGSRAKKDAVQYQCNVCKVWTKSTAIAVDHIAPVVDVDGGFVDWNTFVVRLFCDASNLQVICDTCHQQKTNEERFMRAFPVKCAELSAAESPNADPKDVKKWVRKFNKTLSLYPEDFQKRVLKLKESVCGRKTAKR